ncbi:hypothetical protein B0H66DRAFT_20746 [Apodospora peruviana]|uniref:Mitochondrial ribosomal protein subunit S18 n=1 Tax=Apodospora peruviana TaxID=516989 RepID=A0AAE0IQI3_9PEZI|nr:hypothetical protein B0H66DRAFT_20746 [Apodospora peruviana]
MTTFWKGGFLVRNLFQSLSLSAPRCLAPGAPHRSRAFSQSHVASWDQENTRSVVSKQPDLLSVMNSAVGVSNQYNGDKIADDLALDAEAEEPFHFHIYSHKHNTHITVTKPNRDAIISMSCGNIGLRHAQRKSYDAAYQLAAYVLDKLHQKGVVKQIHKLEVILRGFGPGREAATNVLMGTEGKLLRAKITRVTDATRLKFGGSRSKGKRRLG